MNMNLVCSAGITRISLWITLALWFIATPGCMSLDTPYTPPPDFPASHWGGSYRYSYEPAQTFNSGSISALIAVVNPVYKVEESALMQPAYSKVGKGFSASMGVDMDKVLIAKGMTTVGPYATLDEVIYSHKKNAALTLAPNVFITVDVQYQGNPYYYEGRAPSGEIENRVTQKFKMAVGGWVSFVMQEPLSGEKMWVKKLELETTEMEGVEQFNAVPQYQNTYGFFGEVNGTFVSGYNCGDKLLYNGKKEVLADALKKMYPLIMEKFWIYMDTEEILKLKETTEEIRKLKRY